ncbi:MAG: thioredoxin domain-containing protein [Thermodesulfobacteriota bacterium]
MSTAPHRNRLAREKSPYLLQHAHNPVDWYPWGEEAFGRARSEGKLVFLSIGYSTCHWCHVMERESFEDEEVAAVLNTLTVPVKVDREERPDVDQVYMTVCQALNGSGGWPLTVLLTPDRNPFFAGTYFPKHSRHGRIGVVELVRQAAALWQEDPERVHRAGREIVARLQPAPAGPEESGALAPALFQEAVRLFRGQFDAARGGFGPAPKFPTPHNLVFLVRRWRRTGDPELLRMAETTLDAMRRGGLFDQVGFGFHRYATDANWLLPHFEKMLYDQAGLALAYLEAHQATRKPGYARTAREIFTYALRDLASPEGAFYSAEDADSEGVEGKFYVWTRREVLDVLGLDDGELYCRVQGITEEGNFREEATGEPTGTNIPHLDRPLDAWAWERGVDPKAFAARLESARGRLFSRREGRVRPHRDDKVLTAWNGLMISALGRAAWTLDEPRYARAAARAADFVLSRLRPDGRLLRRFRDGEAAVPAFAEDYAFLARGLLDLYGATFDPARLRQALELARELVQRFGGGSTGALFDTAADAEELVLRPQEVYDGATPSANSVALEVFARLGQLTGDPAWTEHARGIAEAFAGRVAQYPAAFTQFLAGASLLLEPTREVVIAGLPEAPETQGLLSAARAAYAPETALLLAPPGDPVVAALCPFREHMGPVEGRAAAYVCQDFACRAPVSLPEELAKTLEHPA